MQPTVHPELTRAIMLWAEEKFDEALPIIERLADAGDPEAIFALGDVYSRGQVVDQDYPRARALFRQASEAGHGVGQRAYTNLLATGFGGARDWPQAMARLREEARGDARRAQMLRLIEAMPLTESGYVAQPPKGERISERPEITIFRGLFTPAECDFLLTVAEPGYEPMMVVDMSGEEKLDPVRTAEGATIHWLIEDPAIHALNRRLAAASDTRYEQGEPLLILRYQPGQYYKKHLDALPGVDNQRYKTALVYLNDGYEGGETEFSQIGIKVKGRRGDAIVFRNTFEGSRPDQMSEHAGLAVTRGTKYLASRWIRERRYEPRVK